MTQILLRAKTAAHINNTTVIKKTASTANTYADKIIPNCTNKPAETSSKD